VPISIAGGPPRSASPTGWCNFIGPRPILSCWRAAAAIRPCSRAAPIRLSDMDLLTLLAFTIAYIVAVLVPGPGVAAIVARALGAGCWSALPMIVGILVGDLIYLVFALFGLAAIATYFGPIFIVVRWAGALYLLYIAWLFWTAKPGSEQ